MIRAGFARSSRRSLRRSSAIKPQIAPHNAPISRSRLTELDEPAACADRTEACTGRSRFSGLVASPAPPKRFAAIDGARSILWFDADVGTAGEPAARSSLATCTCTSSSESGAMPPISAGGSAFATIGAAPDATGTGSVVATLPLGDATATGVTSGCEAGVETEPAETDGAVSATGADTSLVTGSLGTLGAVTTGCSAGGEPTSAAGASTVAWPA